MNESEIIDHILETGDSDGYRHLVDRYHVGLINYIYGYVKDRPTAEDVAQDAFIRAYEKLHTYDSKFAFSTWLYKIATNMTYSHLKKRRHLPLDEAMLPGIYDDIPDRLDRKNHAHHVRQCIGKLPQNYQAVVKLHYWHGLSYEEVAVAIDAPVGTIKTWMYRAKAQLKKELA